jgi:valyl-tRNA synthetase
MTTNDKELPKAYNPADVEEKWYSYWLKRNFGAGYVEENIRKGEN